MTLPTGAGKPFPEFAAAYAEATGACAAVRTMRATLSLSGRAGRAKLRGDVDAGFAAPASIRLEGRAPFGRPVFILAAREADATLVLPRDNRVLRGAAPAAIVEALTGVALTPGELRATIAGCGFGAAEPEDARGYENGLVAVDAGGAQVYLRQRDGRWRVMAAVRGRLTIEYPEFGSSGPSRIRLRTTNGSTPATDITVRLSDVDINVDLAPVVFEVDVPAGAEPLTLDELRRAGPLGDRQ